MSHMTIQHQFISTTTPKPTFCEFCYEFVLHHELDAHVELHIDAVDSFVKDNGYTGLMGLVKASSLDYVYSATMIRPSTHLNAWTLNVVRELTGSIDTSICISRL